MKSLQMNITFLLTVFLLAASIQAQDSTEASFSLDRELLSAVSFRSQITVRDLLNYGADVHTTTNDGNTPLHLAAQRGHAIITGLLLEKGADVDAVNLAGETPLYFAAREGHIDVAGILLAAGANVNAVFNYHSDDLLLAHYYYYLMYVPQIINDDFQHTPLYEAIERGHADMVWFLLDHGAKVSSLNAFMRNRMIELLRNNPRENR